MRNFIFITAIAASAYAQAGTWSIHNVSYTSSVTYSGNWAVVPTGSVTGAATLASPLTVNLTGAGAGVYQHPATVTTQDDINFNTYIQLWYTPSPGEHISEIGTTGTLVFHQYTQAYGNVQTGTASLRSYAWFLAIGANGQYNGAAPGGYNNICTTPVTVILAIKAFDDGSGILKGTATNIGLNAENFATASSGGSPTAVAGGNIGVDKLQGVITQVGTTVFTNNW